MRPPRTAIPAQRWRPRRWDRTSAADPLPRALQAPILPRPVSHPRHRPFVLPPLLPFRWVRPRARQSCSPQPTRKAQAIEASWVHLRRSAASERPAAFRCVTRGIVRSRRRSAPAARARARAAPPARSPHVSGNGNASSSARLPERDEAPPFAQTLAAACGPNHDLVDVDLVGLIDRVGDRPCDRVCGDRDPAIVPHHVSCAFIRDGVGELGLGNAG